MAPQGAAPASAARPPTHPLLAPAAPSPVQAQPLKAAGRPSAARPAALRWAGLTAAPPPLGRRLEEAAAPGGSPGVFTAASGSAAQQQQQQHGGGAAASSGPRLPAASVVRQRRRQRLVRAAGVAAPAQPAAAGGLEADAEGQRVASWLAAMRWLADDPTAGLDDGGAVLPRRRQGRLSAEQEQTLARTVAGGGRGAEGAAATLAAFNIPLVYHLARRFQGRGLAREDVVGEGLGALLRAARRYRPGTDARFATFATPVIWQAMQKAVHGQSRSVRLPAHHHTDMRRVRAASEQLSAELGHAPRLEAVADRCDLSVEYTAHLVKQMKQGEGRARLPPLATPNSRGAPAQLLSPEDESDEAVEAEEVRAHEAAVQRQVEDLLDRLAHESQKLARVVRLRHRLGEPGAGEEGGTARLRPFKEIGDALGCTGAHASSLYKQAKIKMESLSREAAGRQASQPGTRGHLQQLLEAASRDGRLAAAVARLSEERQLLLALRCGWFQTPWLQGQGRPTFKALAQLWGRSACWASNNCTSGAQELRQIVLPHSDDSFKMLHALESERVQPHFPAHMLQRWDAMARQLQGSHAAAAAPAAAAPVAAEPSAAATKPVAAAQPVQSVQRKPPQSAAQGAHSTAHSAAPAAPAVDAVAVPRVEPAEVAPAALGHRTAEYGLWPAGPDAGASSVVPFPRLRRQSVEAEPEIEDSPEMYDLMAQISQQQQEWQRQQQRQRALAGAR